MILKTTLCSNIRIATGSIFAIRIEQKEVFLEKFVNICRNQIYFVQKQCSDESLRGSCFARAPNVSLIRPRGGLTLCVFLLTSCCVYPTWLGRAATERKQQDDSVVQGPPCHHRAQGSLVNPFGYPPLSDIRPTSSAHCKEQIPHMKQKPSCT